MKRLFIALPLPAFVDETVTQIKSELQRFNQHGRISWVAPGNFHVTIQFLGDQEENTCALLSELLAQTAAAYEPFPLRLTHLDAFPAPLQPRTVVLKCHNEGRALFWWRASLLEALIQHRIAFEEDRRLWTPHITLARNKINGYFFRRLGEIKVPPAAWHANQITLFESTLTPSGPVYTETNTVILKDGDSNAT